MGLLKLLKSYQLTVKSAEEPGGDSCLLRLERPEGLTWEPASYARFILPGARPGKETERALTLASHPDEGEICLLFKSGAGASAYKQALAAAVPGVSLTMRYLYANLKVTSPDLPQIFFASDVGIAAVRPLTLDLLKNNRSQLSIHHLSRGCPAFDDEFQQLAQQDSRLQFASISDEESGRQALEQTADFYGDSAVYYLIGLPAHVREWAKLLREKGISTRQIKKEAFTGLE